MADALNIQDESAVGTFTTFRAADLGSLTAVAYGFEAWGANNGWYGRDVGGFKTWSLSIDGVLSASILNGTLFMPGAVSAPVVAATGNLQLGSTVGVAGNQTISTPSGSVLFAAAAQTITVTSTIVTAASVIQATVATDDATAISCKAIPGAGSFVLKLNAAATAQTKVTFIVSNPSA